MKLKSKMFALSATLFVTVPAVAQQQPKITQKEAGQVTLGAARFTVVSPFCIRLEYAPKSGFVDAPTLFATNRQARDARAKITRNASGVTIETAAMRLVYRPDGQPFNATNLQVTFRNGNAAGSWQPGKQNLGNLGGAATTLDFTNRPINLPNGLISREGWSLIDDSGRPLRTNGWIAPRPGGGPPGEDVPQKNSDFDWYLFAYGQNYQSALQSLTKISGAVAMPRREVLGSWNSRFTKLSADDYRQVVREYEEHDFPLDVMVFDMDWHTQQDAKPALVWSNNPGWTGYTWNKNYIPDPQGLLQEFKDKGIYVTLNDHPHDGMREHEENFPLFTRLLGQTPPPGTDVPFQAGNKQYMDAFWAASHEPLQKQGVDFWWLDWQQDSLVPWVSGVPGLRHLPWLNEYYFQKSEESGLRGQGYSRWGGWGDQRNPMQFSGDTASNWSVLAFEVPFSAASGNSGCFYWAHDTGGFFGSHNAEQYTRWTQFSGLSAALRVHSAGEDRRPWLWGKQAEEAMRVTYHLRSELFPYIYSSVRQCYEQTLPLLRSMYLAYPNVEAAYSAPNQYLYGDNLLVAPIVSPGVGPGFVAQQSVWFPEGRWYHLLSGEKFAGNRHALVTAGLDEVPVYARGGVPIPLQPYTQRMTSSPLSQLRVRCFPGESGKTGTASLYEDDGRSREYKSSGFARTPLSYSRNGDRLEIKVGATAGRYQGQLRSRSYSIELPATNRASQITLRVGGIVKTLTTNYDAATQLNRIAVPAMLIEKPFSVTATCPDADSRVTQEKMLARHVEGVMGNSAQGKDVSSVLAATQNATPEQQQMLLATLGVGLVTRAEGPNYRDNPGSLLFYAPKGVLDGDKVTVSYRSGQSTVRTLQEESLSFGAVTAPRTAPTLDFRIKGQAFHLPQTSNPLLSPNNVALNAKVTVSSTEEGYKSEAVTDGAAEGYPDNGAREWSSNGQKAGASVRLDWTESQSVDRVVLFDRPNSTDDVTSGVLTFSDGTAIEVGALANQGTEVRFAAKSVTWLTFKVTGVKRGTVNAGLSEIAVFSAAAR